MPVSEFLSFISHCCIGLLSGFWTGICSHKLTDMFCISDVGYSVKKVTKRIIFHVFRSSYNVLDETV